jgi:hypothetical protein
MAKLIVAIRIFAKASNNRHKDYTSGYIYTCMNRPASFTFRQCVFQPVLSRKQYMHCGSDRFRGKRD